MADKIQKKSSRAGASGSKEKILAAGLQEFAEHGLAGARVDQIAGRAGVNKAMIYYHFASKDNLYREVIRQNIITQLLSMRRHLEEGGDLPGLFAGASDTYYQLFSKQPQMVKIMLRELTNIEGEVSSEIINSIKGSKLPVQIMKIMSDGVEKGKLRDVDVLQAWVSFVSMNLGYILLSPFINRILDITDIEKFMAERKSAVVDLFLNGVLAK